MSLGRSSGDFRVHVKAPHVAILARGRRRLFMLVAIANSTVSKLTFPHQFKVPTVTNGGQRLMS